MSYYYINEILGTNSVTVAFSLRKVISSYTGHAIKVRRSSDNVEQNIGFNSNDELDTVDLLAFVGSSNGYVSIWYDQSGSGNNLSNTTLSQQPRIVLNGVIDRQNGKPYISFWGIPLLYINFGTNNSNGFAIAANIIKNVIAGRSIDFFIFFCNLFSSFYFFSG